MKDPYTQKLSDKSLQPLIKFCYQNRGTITVIKKLFDRRTGKEWKRENFERWLHPLPARRSQPLHGCGLLLAEIGAKLMERSRRQPAGKIDSPPPIK